MNGAGERERKGKEIPIPTKQRKKVTGFLGEQNRTTLRGNGTEIAFQSAVEAGSRRGI